MPVAPSSRCPLSPVILLTSPLVRHAHSNCWMLWSPEHGMNREAGYVVIQSQVTVKRCPGSHRCNNRRDRGKLPPQRLGWGPTISPPSTFQPWLRPCGSQHKPVRRHQFLLFGSKIKVEHTNFVKYSVTQIPLTCKTNAVCVTA